jgi:hypothetical protein
MFDLEYYNEITDYGKLIEERLEAKRKITVYRKQKDKNKLIENIDYNNNHLIIMNIFNRKHTYAYNKWYDNYYNKLPIKSPNYTYTDEWQNNMVDRLNKLY